MNRVKIIATAAVAAVVVMAGVFLALSFQQKPDIADGAEGVAEAASVYADNLVNDDAARRETLSASKTVGLYQVDVDAWIGLYTPDLSIRLVSADVEDGIATVRFDIKVKDPVSWHEAMQQAYLDCEGDESAWAERAPVAAMDALRDAPLIELREEFSFLYNDEGRWVPDDIAEMRLRSYAYGPVL